MAKKTKNKKRSLEDLRNLNRQRDADGDGKDQVGFFSDHEKELIAKVLNVPQRIGLSFKPGPYETFQEFLSDLESAAGRFLVEAAKEASPPPGDLKEIIKRQAEAAQTLCKIWAGLGDESRKAIQELFSAGVRECGSPVYDRNQKGGEPGNNIYSREFLDTPIQPLFDTLERFASVGELIGQEKYGAGPRHRQAKNEFIREMATIYERATGRKPFEQYYDPRPEGGHKKWDGLFKQFVADCLSATGHPPASPKAATQAIREALLPKKAHS